VCRYFFIDACTYFVVFWLCSIVCVYVFLYVVMYRCLYYCSCAGLSLCISFVRHFLIDFFISLLRSFFICLGRSFAISLGLYISRVFCVCVVVRLPVCIAFFVCCLVNSLFMYVFRYFVMGFFVYGCLYPVRCSSGMFF